MYNPRHDTMYISLLFSFSLLLGIAASSGPSSSYVLDGVSPSVFRSTSMSWECNELPK